MNFERITVMNTLLRTIPLSNLLILLAFTSGFAQKTGSVKGTISDANSKNPLGFVNVSIEGTTQGTVTDIDGAYLLSGLPAGKNTLSFNFVGYKILKKEVEIIAGQTVTLDADLTVDFIQLEDVVISAQASGQQAAINQQINSNTISSVVSKDKIDELPDQNAAESIGRLPGISIQREGGEGTKVVVRGLSPRFNSITVNGERIPSTDADNRSVDLSMISPDMLAGIEVIKALTADKDADAVGGTVNFMIKKAQKGYQVDARADYGYNGQVKQFGQYRGNINLSNRFFNNKVGVILGANYQKADRSNDELYADYVTNGEINGVAIVDIMNLNLHNISETRKRYGANATVDFDILNGNILYNTMLAETDRDQVQLRRRYRIGDSYQEYEMKDQLKETFLWSNSLSGTHQVSVFELNWRVSYSKTHATTPFFSRYRFREIGAYTSDIIEDQGPEPIPLYAKNNLDGTIFHEGYWDDDDVQDANLTGQLDLKYDFELGKKISGFLKTGAKIRQKSRERDFNRLILVKAQMEPIVEADPTRWDLEQTSLGGSTDNILISNFVQDYNSDEFLNGTYDFGLILDRDKLNSFGEEFKYLYNRDLISDLQDYNASEKISAGYLMGELNFIDKVIFSPGLRIESTGNNYTGYIFQLGQADLSDSSGTEGYQEILPMIHLRYKAFDWFDVRLAVTKTLARPDFYNLVPWENKNVSALTLSRGNPELKHTSVWNYDLFFSFYNKYGLFTAGGFYKELSNIDYIRTFYGLVGTDNYKITQPVNADGISKVKGVEFDFQTNLKYLPSPFDGIVFSANYSFINSETIFPLLYTFRDPVTGKGTTVDTVRVGRMPGQAEHIANVSLGYEKKGFSARLSMVYQGNALDIVGVRPENDSYTNDFIRLDFSAQQKLGKNWSVFANINNLTNTPENSYMGQELYVTYEKYFGFTAEIGMRYKFKQ